MAWEISISAEGWSEIREKLARWSRKALIAALIDDKFEAVYEKAGMDQVERAADAERRRIEYLPHDVLAERAFEIIEQNGTCDNGGFGYWIDGEGYHKVWLDD